MKVTRDVSAGHMDEGRYDGKECVKSDVGIEEDEEQIYLLGKYSCVINAAGELCHRRRDGLRFVLPISRRDFTSWTGGRRSWRQNLLLLLKEDLLLDLLLLGDLWR